MTTRPATVHLPCRTHGTGTYPTVAAPVDAVYLRRIRLAGTAKVLTGVLALCGADPDGVHILRYIPTPTELAALRAAGAVEIDDATAALLLRLASPFDATPRLAAAALAEVEDRHRLRNTVAGAYQAAFGVAITAQNGDEVRRLRGCWAAFKAAAGDRP